MGIPHDRGDGWPGWSGASFGVREAGPEGGLSVPKRNLNWLRNEERENNSIR